MSKIDRRKVLTAAVATAAASAVAASAAPYAGPSAEYLELRKLYAGQREVVLERAKLVDYDEPLAAAAGDALIADFDCKIDAVISRINAKPPSIEALVDRAAVFLLACDDGWKESAFDDPDSVLLDPDGIRLFSHDSVDIAGGQLASAVFALARHGGFHV